MLNLRVDEDEELQSLPVEEELELYSWFGEEEQSGLGDESPSLEEEEEETENDEGANLFEQT